MADAVVLALLKPHTCFLSPDRSPGTLSSSLSSLLPKAFPFILSRARLVMSARPSKFLSRASSVGSIMNSVYDLFTFAGQIMNPKSPSTSQSYDNEAAVKDFENAVSALLTMPYLVLLNYRLCHSSRRASRRTMSLMPLSVHFNARSPIIVPELCEFRSRWLLLMRSSILIRLMTGRWA